MIYYKDNDLFILCRILITMSRRSTCVSHVQGYQYIKKNGKIEDLWVVLEEESEEPAKDLMTTWTKQQGYPVIYAKLNGHDLEFEQVC